jgi:hypothetical protein
MMILGRSARSPLGPAAVTKLGAFLVQRYAGRANYHVAGGWCPFASDGAAPGVRARSGGRIAVPIRIAGQPPGVLRVRSTDSLTVSLRVPELESGTLATWFRDLIDQLALDAAAVGVDSEEDEVGVLNYRREPPDGSPPPGVRAEDWRPGQAFFAETASQREALRAWLKGSALVAAPQPVALPSPAKAVAVPSYLKALASAPDPPAAPQPPAAPPAFNADETLPITASIVGETLPFQGTTTPERLRELLPPSSGRAPSDAGATIGIAEPDATRDLVAAIRRVHAITLDEYARIRAALVVAAEPEEEIWSRAGLPAAQDQERLRKRFFDRFQDEPEVRAQFERKLRDAVRKLRGRG